MSTKKHNHVEPLSCGGADSSRPNSDKASPPVPPALVVQSTDVQHTEQLGTALALHLVGGDVVALTGDLGAGKTAFARGMIRGLGVPATVPITSPTFSIINTYAGTELDVHHLDLYRVGALDELESLGLRDLQEDDSVLLIEWPTSAAIELGSAVVWVHMEGKAERREISFAFTGWGDCRLDSALRSIPSAVALAEPRVDARTGTGSEVDSKV